MKEIWMGSKITNYHEKIGEFETLLDFENFPRI